jgi:hypothetical protein
MQRRALTAVLVAMVLVAVACSGGSKDDDSEEGGSRPEDRTTLTAADADPPTTTSTTAVTEPTPASVVADGSGVAGVAVATPPGDLIERLTAALGPPTRDTGFVTSDCHPDSQSRWVWWSDFRVVLDQDQAASPVSGGGPYRHTRMSCRACRIRWRSGPTCRWARPGRSWRPGGPRGNTITRPSAASKAPLATTS